MPTIKFVRSDCPDPHNGLGYMVWTNQYTGHFQCVGFISRKRLGDMKNYFTLEGYNVKVIEDPYAGLNKAFQSEFNYAN